ncbi:response regulator transcription factor [Rubrivirga litoralis]|uniref:Response regulator transcription factor n=1 Tax=Rubrivirga litoralis TaxID=3075598 RepID=A0ABU3BSF4_9BACT|nr:response regulator transcription factor [Rubrivirga sp. F394]MDT0632230.1 response regulator transcription factor [Rubrivirga sp. F394]
MTAPPLRVVLAEDHRIVRAGFQALLAAEPGVEVVAETGDGAEAVALVAEHRPDVLVADLALPGLDGVEVIRRARAASPGTAAVVLSMHDHEAYVARAVGAGASAYVLKESGPEDLAAALRAVRAGGRFFSDGLADPAGRGGSRPLDRYDALSPREREVVHLVAEGLTAPDAAERLFLSPRTVETHRANAMAKLGLGSQAELIRYVLERGLVPPRRPEA